jgi:hypothetical protein
VSELWRERKREIARDQITSRLGLPTAAPSIFVVDIDGPSTDKDSVVVDDKVDVDAVVDDVDDDVNVLLNVESTSTAEVDELTVAVMLVVTCVVVVVVYEQQSMCGRDKQKKHTKQRTITGQTPPDRIVEPDEQTLPPTTHESRQKSQVRDGCSCVSTHCAHNENAAHAASLGGVGAGDGYVCSVVMI